MTSLRPSLLFIAVCALLIGSVPLTVHSSSALRVVGTSDNLSATTNQQLAQARRGTAKYHDIAQAEADGYVNINVYESGEGHGRRVRRPAKLDGRTATT